jgi:hypothetical protein
MARKWTRKERHEYAKEKYYSMKRKIFILVALVAVYIVIIYSLIYSFREGLDPHISMLLIAIAIILIPVTIFVTDTFWFEYA